VKDCMVNLLSVLIILNGEAIKYGEEQE